MRSILICVVAALAACGGDDGGSAGDDGGDDGPSGPTFDGERDDFIDAVCEFDANCNDRDVDTCKADVSTDMTDAKEELDDAGEAECAECMRVTTQVVGQLGPADCDLTPSQRTMVDNACGEANEACAGFP